MGERGARVRCTGQKGVKRNGGASKSYSFFYKELVMSQMVKQEALARLLVEKRIFAKEGVLEMARGVDRDNKR